MPGGIRIVRLARIIRRLKFLASVLAIDICAYVNQLIRWRRQKILFTIDVSANQSDLSILVINGFGGDR